MWTNVELVRIPRNPAAPPMSRQEALERAHEARRGAKPITAEQSRRRFQLVERLLVSDVSPAELARICREELDMSGPAVERTKTKVLQAWGSADAELRSVRRLQARKRLLRIITRAMKADDWRAAIAAEALLAKIDGLVSERMRVDVHDGMADRVNGALASVIGSLTEEERDRMLAEYDELQARAARAPLH
jgi:hypothetical protein